MPKLAKIVTPHSSNCRAVEYVAEGVWDTPWFFDTRSTKAVRMDSIGRRTKYGCFWHIGQCNSVDCPAEIAINVSAVEVLLHEATSG